MRGCACARPAAKRNPTGASELMATRRARRPKRDERIGLEAGGQRATGDAGGGPQGRQRDGRETAAGTSGGDEQRRHRQATSPARRVNRRSALHAARQAAHPDVRPAPSVGVGRYQCGSPPAPRRAALSSARGCRRRRIGALCQTPAIPAGRRACCSRPRCTGEWRRETVSFAHCRPADRCTTWSRRHDW